MTTMIERVARALSESDGQFVQPQPWHFDYARAAIAAMREGMPDFGDYPLIERLARECESAHTDDETWKKFQALAEWVSCFDAALEEKP